MNENITNKTQEILSKYSMLRILGVMWLLVSYFFIFFKCKHFWADNEDWGFWALLGLTFFGIMIICTDEVSRILVKHLFHKKLNRRLFDVQLFAGICFFLWLVLSDSPLLKF